MKNFTAHSSSMSSGLQDVGYTPSKGQRSGPPDIASKCAGEPLAEVSHQQPPPVTFRKGNAGVPLEGVSHPRKARHRM